MFKKIFYSLTILAMLFGMFGVMGRGGVTPAFAAAGFNVGGAGSPANAAGVANNTPLPFYVAAVPVASLAPSAGTFIVNGACTGSTIDDSAGGDTTWLGIGANPSLTYLRIRVNPAVGDRSIVGVFAQNDPTPLAPTPLGCASNAVAVAVLGQGYDLVVAAPAFTQLYVVLGKITTVATPAGTTEVFIQRTANASGGLIVQSRIDAAVVPNAAAQVQNVATADKQQTIVDANGIAWFDVPAGIYNLGYACNGLAGGCNVGAPYVARYAGIVAGGYAVREPRTNSITTATFARVEAADPIGGLLNLNYKFRPADAAFGYDFDMGRQVTTQVIGITAGPWTVQGYIEGANHLPAAVLPDYDLFSTQLFPVGANTIVDFRLNLMGGVSATRVMLCVPALRNAATIDLTVAPFDLQTFNFFNGGLTSAALECPLAADLSATQGGYMYLSTVFDYDALAEVRETTNADWRFFIEPAPYPFPIATPGVLADSWFTVFADVDGDTFFSTTDLTGGPEFVMPTSSVTLARDTWNDASGNLLTRVTGPDNSERDCLTALPIVDAGVLRDEIAPCYSLWHGLDGEALLANDWLLTDFTPAVEIGRYEYYADVQTHSLAAVAADVDAEDLAILFAVSPSDTPMLGHWAWSWVEAMYELDLTNGISANNYAPDNTMTRAEMAKFLSAVLSEYSSIPAAGVGVGGVFTDVLAGFWAGGAIEQLESLGITSGIGGGLYGPDLPVTRAEMAKFIQLTFRAARMYGWTGCDGTDAGLACTGPFGNLATLDLWDPNQNVLAPGLTFVDVPADHWANLWIEEMWWDNLTDGCRTEMAGPFVWINYFCPADPVTRGQMAKFILTAAEHNFVTQWVWPVLAPER